LARRRPERRCGLPQQSTARARSHRWLWARSRGTDFGGGPPAALFAALSEVAKSRAVYRHVGASGPEVPETQPARRRSCAAGSRSTRSSTRRKRSSQIRYHSRHCRGWTVCSPPRPAGAR
jgi:hypothetical protein